MWLTGKLNVYEFPFVIFNPSDINVYFNDKVQDSASYTVIMSKNTEGGALRAKVLNNEFDYQMACQQQIANNLNRSMVLPPYAVDTDMDLTLPTPSADKAIV